MSAADDRARAGEARARACAATSSARRAAGAGELLAVERARRASARTEPPRAPPAAPRRSRRADAVEAESRRRRASRRRPPAAVAATRHRSSPPERAAPICSAGRRDDAGVRRCADDAAAAPSAAILEPVAARGARRDRRGVAADARAASRPRSAPARSAGCARRARNAVPGVGSARSGIVFVGEAPGADEDRRASRSSAAPASCSTDHQGDGRRASSSPACRSIARDGLHLQRAQVPAAREPQPAAARDRAVLALPACASSRRSSRASSAASASSPPSCWSASRARSAAMRGQDLPLPGRQADRDLPSRRVPAEPGLQAPGVGGHAAAGARVPGRLIGPSDLGDGAQRRRGHAMTDIDLAPAIAPGPRDRCRRRRSRPSARCSPRCCSTHEAVGRAVEMIDAVGLLPHRAPEDLRRDRRALQPQREGRPHHAVRGAAQARRARGGRRPGGARADPRVRHHHREPRAARQDRRARRRCCGS